MRIRPARIAAGAYEALVYVFLALPTLVVVGASLNTAELLSFPPTMYGRWDIRWIGR